MRRYPTDSPEATARIIALALMADGAIDVSEEESMQHHHILDTLGLNNQLLDKVIHEYCEDVLSFAHQTPAGQHELDPASVDGLLQEISDSALQGRLFSSILSIINAGGQVQGSEVLLIVRALKVWSLDADSNLRLQQLPQRRRSGVSRRRAAIARS